MGPKIILNEKKIVRRIVHLKIKQQHPHFLSKQLIKKI